MFCVYFIQLSFVVRNAAIFTVTIDICYFSSIVHRVFVVLFCVFNLWLILSFSSSNDLIVFFLACLIDGSSI